MLLVANNNHFMIDNRTTLANCFIVFVLFFIYNNNYNIDAHENKNSRSRLFQRTIELNLRRFNISDTRSCGYTRRHEIYYTNDFNCSKQIKRSSSLLSEEEEEECGISFQQPQPRPPPPPPPPPTLPPNFPPVGHYPSHVILYCGINGVQNNLCNGILISDELVLTSAECVFRQNYCKATFGFRSASDPRYEQVEFVWGYCLLKNYTNYYPDKHNDVALLQLNKPIRFNENTQPACLDILNSKHERAKCISIGFYDVYNTNRNAMLKTVRMESIFDENKLRFDSIGRTGYMPQMGSNLCVANRGSGLYCMSVCNNAVKQYAIGLFSFKEKEDPTYDCQQREPMVHYFSDFSKLGKNFKSLVENCYEMHG